MYYYFLNLQINAAFFSKKLQIFINIGRWWGGSICYWGLQGISNDVWEVNCKMGYNINPNLSLN